MAAVPGDVSAASGCGNRVEEAFEQFLRGAVTEYLARPSIEITRIGIPKKITPLLYQLEVPVIPPFEIDHANNERNELANLPPNPGGEARIVIKPQSGCHTLAALRFHDSRRFGRVLPISGGRIFSPFKMQFLLYKHKIKNSSLNVLLILTKESISLNSEIAHFSFNKFAYLTDFDRQSFDFHFKGDRMPPVSCGVTVRRDENRPFERGREKTFPLRTVRCAPSPLGRGIGGSIRLSFDPHRCQAGNISPSKIKYPPSRET